MKNRKRWLIAVTAMTILVVLICIILTVQLTSKINGNTNFNIESLRWSIIGAIGGWAGSIFGAAALIISILAFELPQKVKIEVGVSTGFMLSQMPGIDRIGAYIITVKNVGLRPTTVNNVYLHFEGDKSGDVFVGVLNQGSILEPFTVKFPKRLDQGESFDYYLLKNKLDLAIAHEVKDTALDATLMIRVDDVVNGSKYYKTKFTLGTFLGHLKK